MAEPSRELLPAPEGVRAFTGEAFAGIADCAPSGRVRVDAIARWLQDIAYRDVLDVGLQSVAVWVVRRTRIRVRRWPRFSECLQLTTFCTGLGRMWAERRTDIGRPGESLADVEAVSLWVHLDPSGGLPVALTEREIEAYSPAGRAPRRVTARLRHPGPPESPSAPPSLWTFRATEADVAAHINNAAYWKPLEEELLAGAEPRLPFDVELEHRGPAQPGPVRWLVDGSRRWIVSDDGETLASLLLA